ncbi:MAG: sigma-70 family RNA polymerase sigma factor [Kiritimatiellae bacterium]|nr:sigma-70 family RNA polymerase sigma factor [Kiritimatiellia bacterium]
MAIDDTALRELAEQAAIGDPDAAERLIRGFHRYLMTYLYVSGIPEADINDVAQEVALQAYRSLHRYSADRPFLPWMRGIAAHRVKNYWRTQSRKQTREGLFREYVERQLADERTVRALADTPSERLQDCIRRLPEKQQQILALRYAQGLNANEISERLKREAAAVRKALSRIRDALRACLDGPIAGAVR